MKRVLMGLAAATAVSLGVTAPASADRDPDPRVYQVFIVTCQYHDGTRQGFTVIGGAFAGTLCQYVGAARVVGVVPLH